MNTDKNTPAGGDGQNASGTQKQGEQPLNPFEKNEEGAASRKLTEEEAAAEQQRKEALTERD